MTYTLVPTVSVTQAMIDDATALNTNPNMRVMIVAGTSKTLFEIDGAVPAYFSAYTELSKAALKTIIDQAEADAAETDD